jgi:hypothetical protein
VITVPAERFAAEYWGRGPLLSRAADLGQDFSDLFSIEAVDELVADRAIRTPFVRMANEGSVLPPSRYTGPAGFGAEVGDQLDPDKVLAEFAAGATLVLQGLHRTWAPLREFTRQLVQELGHPAQVNAYITPASSRGFDPHYDVHDVFVIQVHGSKHWQIHEPVHPDPLRDQPWSDHAEAVARQVAGTPVIDETFEPGDVLYLPRGWIHSATALGGTSIHLTIGVSALTRWDVVQQLVASLADKPALRESLPIGFDGLGEAELAAIVADTVSALSAAASDRGDARAIGASLRAKLQGLTRPQPVRPISTVELLGDLENARVRWRGGLGATVERDETHVHIVFGARTVTLPVEAGDAIESLAAGVAAPATALVGLDAESSLVVSRRLVREGILVIA